MPMVCLYCGKQLSGKQTKFCSKSCLGKYRYRASRLEYACEKCGKIFQTVWAASRKILLCKTCSMLERNWGGSRHPRWQGGSSNWRKGRYGRDKDGLSWSVQQRLAWERDYFTCQDCGKKELGWKPHVHHVRPYRLSFSHAIINLICLCEKCHPMREATVKDLWEGVSRGGSPSPREKLPECRTCGRTRKLREGLCFACVNEAKKEKVFQLRDEGLSQFEIGEIVGRSEQTISRWLDCDRGRLSTVHARKALLLSKLF